MAIIFSLSVTTTNYFKFAERDETKVTAEPVPAPIPTRAPAVVQALGSQVLWEARSV